MSILIVISIISIMIYMFFIAIFLNNIVEHRKSIKQHSLPVSIICSARNEEHNIRRFLDALLIQEYDLNLVQVIIVDDCSEDKTKEILALYKDKFIDYDYFTSEGRETVVSAKKNALTQAISKAKHEIILTSDADCIPAKTWINGVVDTYQNNQSADMVVGFSETNIGQRITSLNKLQKSLFKSIPFYALFEHFDFLTLMFATAASINASLYLSCSGQNLSFKKSSFDSVGGYKPIERYISGDDLHLMQLFKQNKMNIFFANNTSARVKTQAIQSFSKLFNQRARWASNMKYMLSSNFIFFVYLLAVFLVTTLIPILLFWQFSVIVLIFIKIIIDLTFIIHSMKAFRIWDRFSGYGWRSKLNFYSLFFSWTIMQPLYTLIISFLGVFSLFKWKDRKGFEK